MTPPTLRQQAQTITKQTLVDLVALTVKATGDNRLTESETLIITSVQQLTLTVLMLIDVLEGDSGETFKEWRRQELEKSNQGVPDANGLE